MTSIDRNGPIRSVRSVAALFLALRGALFVFVYMTLELLPMRSPNPYRPLNAFPESRFWDAFARWDSGWYYSIVEKGYELNFGQSNVAFFPAFPILSKWLAPAFGGSAWAAGLFVSNAALFAGLVALHLLVREDADERAADRAVLFVLVFPATVFFSAFYTEGLFFFCVTASLLAFRREKMLLAGLLGCAAALTRSTGVLLAPAFVLAILHARRYNPRRLTLADARAMLCCVLIPLGTAIFAYHLDKVVHQPLAFLEAQANWGRGSFELPWTAIYKDALAEQHDFYRYVEVMAGAGVFIACFFAPKRLPAEQTIFLVLSTLMPLSTGTTDSMMRIAATIVPIYPLLAKLTGTPLRERVTTVVFTLLAALTTIRFVLWHWAG